MKKSAIAIAIVLFGSTSLVNADQRLVAADDSALSKLCIAATEVSSRQELLALTTAAGISSPELPTIRCNNQPISRFAFKYSSMKTAGEPAQASKPLGYLLRKTDESPFTELCAAAAMSEQEFSKVKQLYFTNDDKVEVEVMCNGIPLKSFVRKYRNVASLQRVSQR